MDIYTIGHSTRTINKFIEILIKNKIRCVVDVRSYPGSKNFPQFNKEALELKLNKYRIRYIHMPLLGGRRNLKTVLHTSILAPGFSSYAEYMMTDNFKKGLAKLKSRAKRCKTAYMCAEGPWWRSSQNDIR